MSDILLFFVQGFEEKDNQLSPNLPKRTPPSNILYPSHNDAPRDDREIHTMLHSRGKDSYLTYGNAKWKIVLKKEVAKYL